MALIMIFKNSIISIWRRRRLRSRASKLQFSKWQEGFNTSEYKLINSDDKQKTGKVVKGSAASIALLQSVKDTLTKGKKLSLLLGSSVDLDTLELRRSELSIQADVEHFGKVTVTKGGGPAKTALDGINIREIHLGCSSVELSDCIIGKLVIQRDSSCKLTVSHCLIGELSIASNSLKQLNLVGGEVGTFSVNWNSNENPIEGDSFLRNLFVATNENQNPYYVGPDALRKMRKVFDAKDNAAAAHQMHGLVLRAEREGDNGVIRFVSWLYGITADYGLKPGRPLLLMLALWALVAMTIYLMDGAILGIPDVSIIGWRDDLQDEDGRLLRSLILPTQTLSNPFGVFGIRQTVIAANWLAQIVIFLQGLLSLALLATTAISIRRRFKVHL